jgi:hypothetical protein
MNRMNRQRFLSWSLLLLLLGGLLDGAKLIVDQDARAMSGAVNGRSTGFYGH